MQSLAILLDSIRDLRSRYLFWISLWISILAAVALLGLIGFNEQGWRILWFETQQSTMFRAGSPGARDMMSWIFNELYVRWWLCWGAIVLGIISTASVIPEFLAGGSIDLALSKPIWRIKLIGLKIGGALLFVGLQVAIGVIVAWLLVGIKVGVWIGSALWAIPLVTLQFFYLYSISAVIAVLTRSTLTSMLLTVLLWGLFSVVQFASNQIDSQYASATALIEALDRSVQRIKQAAEGEGRALNAAELRRVAQMEGQIETNRPIAKYLGPWRTRAHAMEALVPKTADIQKILSTTARAPSLTELGRDMFEQQFRNQLGIEDEDELDAIFDASQKGKAAARQVDPTYSILTSLGLPGLALGLAIFVFARRDF